MTSVGERRKSALGSIGAIGLAAIAGLSLSVGVLATQGSRAAAQDLRWLENVPGFGGTSAIQRRSAYQRPPRENRPEVLNDLRQGPTPLRSDESLASLEKAMERLRRIVERGGWPQIPGNRMIRPGDDDERVPALSRRLMLSGDMPRYDGFMTISYGSELEAGVRRFQERHGLRVSGRVDRPTLQALNVPAAARLRQLQLNHQRIRQLMDMRVEDRYVLVNVPAFQLEAVDRHTVEQRHRVIAGKPDRQTPVVTATIKALNFFPFWRVPESVANLDLIPRLRKEPDYLQKEQIRVLTGSFVGPEIDATSIDWNQVDATKIRFRQDPGERNALGLVRIDMPNEHGVYMHDTPMKPLFEQRGRAFSAGCVRVQNVFDLAAWIGKEEPGFDRRRIDEILSAGKAEDITLTRPLPVHFVYITAWAEPDGRVEFRPDIYGRDGLTELASDRERDPDAPPLPREGLAP